MVVSHQSHAPVSPRAWRMRGLGQYPLAGEPSTLSWVMVFVGDLRSGRSYDLMLRFGRTPFPQPRAHPSAPGSQLNYLRRCLSPCRGSPTSSQAPCDVRTSHQVAPAHRHESLSPSRGASWNFLLAPDVIRSCWEIPAGTQSLTMSPHPPLGSTQLAYYCTTPHPQGFLERPGLRLRVLA